MCGSARTEQIYIFNQIVYHTSDSISIILLVQQWQQQHFFFFFLEQIKQYILESFHNILWADIGQAAQFHELSSLWEKKNIQSRYSQITDPCFCILSLYIFSFYLFCCTHPLCSVLLFCFFMFFLREQLTSAILHTQTLHGFPLNVILPWSHMNHFFGCF